jgi:hypothetical protein
MPKLSTILSEEGLLQRVAAKPVVAPSVLAQLKGFHQDLKKILSELSKLQDSLRKERENLEDVYDREERDWVAAGNHPDDFSDPKKNPRGHSLSQAVEAYEVAEKTLQRFPPGAFVKSPEVLEELLRNFERANR